MKFISTLFLGLCFFLLSLTSTQAQTICDTSPTPLSTNVTVSGRTVDAAYDLDGDGMVEFGFSPSTSPNGSAPKYVFRMPAGIRLGGVAFSGSPGTVGRNGANSGLTDFLIDDRPAFFVTQLTGGGTSYGFVVVDASETIVAVGTTTEDDLTFSSLGCPDVMVSTTVTAPIPTMSQWGLMVFALLIMNLGVFFVQRSVLV